VPLVVRPQTQRHTIGFSGSEAFGLGLNNAASITQAELLMELLSFHNCMGQFPGKPPVLDLSVCMTVSSIVSSENLD
jgi:hypothetical protein